MAKQWVATIRIDKINALKNRSNKKRAPPDALHLSKRLFLLQVFRKVLGHIKHRYLCFATENNFQFSITIDHTSVDFVL